MSFSKPVIMPYDFKTIESKWQAKWQNQPELYRAKDNDSSQEKKYILVEFPYPSGNGLHIGHAFTFTGGDVYARFCRMRGYNTLFPMGWDAFGLPTENYAIKMKRNPQDITNENTALFKKQCHDLGMSFDWSREVNTTDPAYYKWTQWIFIKLFEKGLAFKKKMPINWCPSCKIGLANEEVVDGSCERCGAPVDKKELSQWVVKITAYADRLIDDLDKTDFIDKVKAAQINWIDRTYGINIDYPLVDDPSTVISCYSTRPDTNFGAAFLVLAPENPLVLSLVAPDCQEAVNAYIQESRSKSQRQRIADYTNRSGVFIGRYCLNRLTGKKMPIYAADFVIFDAGTGAVVGVPAHDERDFDFAKQNNLDIIPVIKPEEDWDFSLCPYTDIDHGVVFNSDFLNGLPPRQAKEKIMDYLEESGWGKKTKNYHLRDWIFSRQHYWGEPIPMVFCQKCYSDDITAGKSEEVAGWSPVDLNQLPVELPWVEKYEPTETGESPLSSITEWVNTTCPRCGGHGRRETDTMPNWAGSDWYFARYTDPHNDTCLADKDRLSHWLPVDVYVGGDEHNTLHLLYSRFIYKFLFDIGAVPQDEPYFKRLSHGVILGPDGARMSKSRGNIIVPDEIAARFGADTVRAYLMFIGPFDATMVWNEAAVGGIHRFLSRVFSFIDSLVPLLSKKASPESVLPETHRLIKRVTEDISSFKFNTALAAMMEYLNKAQNFTIKTQLIDARIFIKLLAPLAPFLSEELWERLGGKNSAHCQSWPEFDDSLIMAQEVELPIQIDGKIKGKISVNPALSNEDTLSYAKTLPLVVSLLEGRKIIKELAVAGRIISFVTE